MKFLFLVLSLAFMSAAHARLSNDCKPPYQNLSDLIRDCSADSGIVYRCNDNPQDDCTNEYRDENLWVVRDYVHSGWDYIKHPQVCFVGDALKIEKKWFGPTNYTKEKFIWTQNLEASYGATKDSMLLRESEWKNSYTFDQTTSSKKTETDSENIMTYYSTSVTKTKKIPFDVKVKSTEIPRCRAN